MVVEDSSMDVFTENNFNGKIIDHLGLVADKIKDLNLVSLIDQRLPISMANGAKVSMGERVSAMIINGLGFINTRLYMFPQFLQNKAVNKLFGREIDVKYFNDDALGRCLDAISAYGTTKLFTELSFCIGTNKKLLAPSVHFDTSTIQVYGNYAEDEQNNISDISASIPKPNYGYSKSCRHDLKQMVINLATTGKANFPIWMEAHSGNSSDQTIMPQAAITMNKFCMQLKEAPSFLYVGDSAIYANILQHSNTIKWLTRVPETILQAKQLLRKTEPEICWHELDDGYKYHVAEADYGNVKQRWVLIYSQHAFAKEIKTLERSINKEYVELEKQLRVLGRQEFKCKHDAEAALKPLRKKLKYHRILMNIEALSGYSKKGRPAATDIPEIIGYRMQCTLERNETLIDSAKLKKGRFILATNELSTTKIADKDILKEYKQQSGVEKGFKFIKDNAFEVDSIFLKTPARISALMMIMTLCLMVYGVSEYDFRKSLQDANDTIPDQLKKATNKPSMKWIYYLFQGVQELTITTGAITQKLVINLNAILKKIISYFGVVAQAIYLNPA